MTTPQGGTAQAVLWDVTEYEPDTAGYEPLGQLEAATVAEAHQAACDRWPHVLPERIRIREAP